MGTYSVALPWARMAFCRDLSPPSPSEALVPNRTRTTPMASTISMITKRTRTSEVTGRAPSITIPLMGYPQAAMLAENAWRRPHDIWLRRLLHYDGVLLFDD